MPVMTNDTTTWNCKSDMKHPLIFSLVVISIVGFIMNDFNFPSTMFCGAGDKEDEESYLCFLFNTSSYVRSRSDDQLRDPRNENSTDACKPENLANGAAIVPCGLIAWSLFNDTYDFSINKRNVTINKKDISWKSDRDHKFGNNVYPKNFQNSSIIGGKHLTESIPVSIYTISYFI